MSIESLNKSTIPFPTAGNSTVPPQASFIPIFQTIQKVQQNFKNLDTEKQNKMAGWVRLVCPVDFDVRNYLQNITTKSNKEESEIIDTYNFISKTPKEYRDKITQAINSLCPEKWMRQEIMRALSPFSASEQIDLLSRASTTYNDQTTKTPSTFLSVLSEVFKTDHFSLGNSLDIPDDEGRYDVCEHLINEPKEHRAELIALTNSLYLDDEDKHHRKRILFLLQKVPQRSRAAFIDLVESLKVPLDTHFKAAKILQKELYEGAQSKNVGIEKGKTLVNLANALNIPDDDRLAALNRLADVEDHEGKTIVDLVNALNIPNGHRLEMLESLIAEEVQNGKIIVDFLNSLNIPENKRLSLFEILRKFPEEKFRSKKSILEAKITKSSTSKDMKNLIQFEEVFPNILVNIASLQDDQIQKIKSAIYTLGKGDVGRLLVEGFQKTQHIVTIDSGHNKTKSDNKIGSTIQDCGSNSTIEINFSKPTTYYTTTQETAQQPFEALLAHELAHALHNVLGINGSKLEDISDNLNQDVWTKTEEINAIALENAILKELGYKPRFGHHSDLDFIKKNFKKSEANAIAKLEELEVSRLKLLLS